MIIRCQSGRLLETAHVVEWDTDTDDEGNEQRHTVTAKTILGTTIEVFRGEASECVIRLREIEDSLNNEHTLLMQICKGFAERDDTLSKSIAQLASALQRFMSR